MASAPVFLSGGSGFVGTAVLRELMKRNCTVHAVIHGRDLKVKDDRIKALRGELDNPHLLEEALAGCGAAIHLVGIIAENPAKGVTFQRMHVEMTRAVVQGCEKAGVKRYIHMSAAGTRDDAPSVYHKTKALAEHIVENSTLAWTIFRPSLIHGPEGEFSHMLLGWATGKAAPYVMMPYFGAGWFGTGSKYLVQPIHVDDVARAFVDALNNSKSIGKHYDLGGEQRLSWPELYRTFSRTVTGKEKLVFAIPAWYALTIARGLPRWLLPFTEGQVQMSQEHNIAEMRPFQADFGYLPEGFSSSLAKYASELQH